MQNKSTLGGLGNPLRVLVVDDSKAIQRLIGSLLVKLGHTVVAFGNDGEEAFSLYKEHKPDLVLLDITMPNVDGREGLKLILKHDQKARVIICSALRCDNLREDCLKSGAVGFIDKEKITLTGSDYLSTTIADTCGLSQQAA